MFSCIAQPYLHVFENKTAIPAVVSLSHYGLERKEEKTRETLLLLIYTVTFLLFPVFL